MTQVRPARLAEGTGQVLRTLSNDSSSSSSSKSSNSSCLDRMSLHPVHGQPAGSKPTHSMNATLPSLQHAAGVDSCHCLLLLLAITCHLAGACYALDRCASMCRHYQGLTQLQNVYAWHAKHERLLLQAVWPCVSLTGQVRCCCCLWSWSHAQLHRILAA